jgi:hypothetical protein
MNRRLVSSITLALLLAGGVWAQGSNTAAPAAPDAVAPAGAKPAKVTGYPFRGKLKGVSPEAMTFTLAGKGKDRIFHVTADTKFVRDGKAVALGDGVAGEEVAGYARNEGDGKAQALSVRFGSAPAADPQKTPTRQAPKPQPAAE